MLLSLSGFLFIVSQLFNFVISVHLCKATDGKIDGALFETLFVLLAVTTLYFFWSSITEDEWPDETGTSLMAEPDYGTAPYSRSNMGGV